MLNRQETMATRTVKVKLHPKVKALLVTKGALTMYAEALIAQHKRTGQDLPVDASNIDNSLLWVDTPQGQGFWDKVDNAIIDLNLSH